jgi:hypothetical protein
MNHPGHPKKVGRAPGAPTKFFTGGCGEESGCAILAAHE